MNDKRDMAPMVRYCNQSFVHRQLLTTALRVLQVWGYIKSRETARRMEAYAGEVTGKTTDNARTE